MWQLRNAEFYRQNNTFSVSRGEINLEETEKRIKVIEVFLADFNWN